MMENVYFIYNELVLRANSTDNQTIPSPSPTPSSNTSGTRQSNLVTHLNYGLASLYSLLVSFKKKLR